MKKVLLIAVLVISMFAGTSASYAEPVIYKDPPIGGASIGGEFAYDPPIGGARETI